MTNFGTLKADVERLEEQLRLTNVDQLRAEAQLGEAVGLIYGGGHGISDLCCAPRNASVPRKAKGCQQCTFLADLEKGDGDVTDSRNGE